MKEFFNALAPAIRQAVQSAMEKIRREAGDEHIYAAALVTDSDCVTVFLAVNTEEALEKRDKEDRTEERLRDLAPYLSQEKLRQIADGTVSLNRWLPDEWGYSDGTDSHLNSISRQLFDKEATLSNTADELYDEVHEQFQTLLLEALTSVFLELRAEGAFGPEVTCFVSMSDDERTPEIEHASARRLNTPEQYAMFTQLDGFFD